MCVYRRMLRVSWTVRMTNASVLERMEKDCEIIKSKIRKRQYFGHIMRNSKYRILLLGMEGKIEGRRPRGTRKISWLRDLRHWYGKTSIELFRAAANKIAIANMIANVRQDTAQEEEEEWFGLDQFLCSLTATKKYVLFFPTRCLNNYYMFSKLLSLIASLQYCFHNFNIIF